jgi:hypothetical protein
MKNGAIESAPFIGGAPNAAPPSSPPTHEPGGLVAKNNLRNHARRDGGEHIVSVDTHPAIATRRRLKIMFMPVVDGVLAVTVVGRQAVASMPAARATVIVEAIVLIGARAVVRSTMIVVGKSAVLLLSRIRTMIVRAAPRIVLRERGR